MRGVFRVGVCVSASALALVMALGARVETPSGVTDAPAGFDVVSNGFAQEYCTRQDHLTNSPNSPGVEADECSFDSAVAEFGASETEADGVGPVFNATGCGQCHIAPTLGGGSQIAERRAGFFNGF